MNRIKIRKMLQADEGIAYRPYRCTSGKLTIGIGRNLEDKNLSENVINLMLEEDVQEAEKGARQIFGEQFDTFSENRQLALINLVFNMGIKTFSTFINTIALMKAEKWVDASVALLDSRYAKQVKGRALRVAEMLSRDAFPYK